MTVLTCYTLIIDRPGAGACRFSWRPGAVQPPAVPGVEEKGLVKIANEKRVAWHKIRADYIAGVSQRKLADQYKVPRSAIERHSRLEHWTEQREAAKVKVQETVVQKTADFAAENAVRAQRIKAKLLERLETLSEAYLKATETRSYDLAGNLTEINRLRDLTSAYKDLTGDTLKLDAAEEELDRARDILGGVDSVIE